MGARFYDALERAPRSIQVAGCLALIALVGVVDHLTGYEIAFSIFYLAPVSLAAWHISRSFAVVIAALSAVTWLAMDLSAGHPYSHPAIAYWNATVRLCFFLITALLLARIRHYVREAESRARIDSLTGVLNVRGLFEKGNLHAQLAARHGRPLSILCIDLDDFKNVNDTRGHAEGDRLLRAVADELTRAVRASDVLARSGGDEFVVLLPETNFAGAGSVIEKIQAGLARCFADGGWSVGASLGAASFDRVPADLSRALAVADALLYESKHAGKGRSRHASVTDAAYQAATPAPPRSTSSAQ